MRLLRPVRLSPVVLAVLMLLLSPIGLERALGLCGEPLHRGAVIFTGVVTEAPDTGILMYVPLGGTTGIYRFEVEQTKVGDAGNGLVYLQGGEDSAVLLPGRRYEVHADPGGPPEADGKAGEGVSLVVYACSLTRELGTTPAAFWADVGRLLRELAPLLIALGILITGAWLAFRRPILAAAYVWTAAWLGWGVLDVSQQGSLAGHSGSLVDALSLWAPFLTPWMVGMAIIGLVWLARRGWPGSMAAGLLLAGFAWLCAGAMVRGLIGDGTLFGGDFGMIGKALILGGIISYLIGFVLAVRQPRWPDRTVGRGT